MDTDVWIQIEVAPKPPPMKIEVEPETPPFAAEPSIDDIIHPVIRRNSGRSKV